jgi:hypothetical protein
VVSSYAGGTIYCGVVQSDVFNSPKGFVMMEISEHFKHFRAPLKSRSRCSLRMDCEFGCLG